MKKLTTLIAILMTLAFSYSAVAATIISEGFEGAGPVPPTDWTLTYANPSPPSGNLCTNTMDQAHSGSWSFRFSSYSSGAPYPQYLITPGFIATDVSVSFWYRRYTWGSEAFRVGWSSTGTSTNDFTYTDEITDASTTWQQYTTNVPDGTKYICIHYNSDYDYYLYVDDVLVTGTPDPPTFTATLYSASRIDLAWTKNPSGHDVMVAYNTNNVNEFTQPTDGTAYSAGNTIGPAMVLYNGGNLSYNHTGLDSDTHYYYKAWSVDSSDNYSAGNTANATTGKVEPSNYPTSFDKNAICTDIELTWTGSTGPVLPDSYLIVGKTGGGTYPSVVDGTPVADDTDWSDNSAAMNVTHQAGDNSYIFTGLDALTAYDFRIYPYANSGTFIDYKTDGTPPELSATTKDPILLEGFNTNALPAGWTTNVVDEGSGSGSVTAGGGISFVMSSTSPTASPSEGTHFVKWYSFLVIDGAETRLETPGFSTSTNRNISVGFQWFESTGYSTYSNEGVTVQWSLNGTTWNDVQFFMRIGDANDWKLKSCQLPSGANGQATVYVGLKFHSQYGYNCYVDDFKVCGDIIPEPAMLGVLGLALLLVRRK